MLLFLVTLKMNMLIIFFFIYMFRKYVVLKALLCAHCENRNFNKLVFILNLELNAN
jgi:hypothetical protein